MPRLNCMDMRLMCLGLPVLCKSLGFDPSELSKLTCRGLPWPSRKAGYPCRRRCRLPWLSEEVLGSRPGVAYCQLLLHIPLVMLLTAAEQQAATHQVALQPSNGAVYSGNARKAFMDEAERLAQSERQPPAAEQQGKRRRAFD